MSGSGNFDPDRPIAILYIPNQRRTSPDRACQVDTAAADTSKSKEPASLLEASTVEATQKLSELRQGTTQKLSEVRPSPGKGLGTFALQDIKRGTRFMCERPLVHLSPDGPNAIQMFSKLSKADQGAYLSLYGRWRGKDAATAFSTQESMKVQAIANTNAFATTSGGAICLEASRINHSCSPNAHWEWNDTIEALTVHAIRDISAGEEITIAYKSIHTVRELRQEYLAPYSFTCNCPACDLTTTFGKMSEKRRLLLAQVDQLWYSFKNASNALALVLACISIMKKEGLYDRRLSQYYTEATYYCQKLDRWDDALQWEETNLELVRTLVGADYPHLQEREQRFREVTSGFRAKNDILARASKEKDLWEYDMTDEEEKTMLGICLKLQARGCYVRGVKDPMLERKVKRMIARARMMGQIDENGNVRM